MNFDAISNLRRLDAAIKRGLGSSENSRERRNIEGELFVRPCDHERLKDEGQFEGHGFRRLADGVAALLETNLTR